MKIPVPFLGSEIHVKNRRRLRWVEEKRQVPLIMLGPLCISYWSRRTIADERRFGGRKQ